MGGNYSLLIITVGFILFLGVGVPYIASPFIINLNQNSTSIETTQTSLDNSPLNLSGVNSQDLKGINVIGGNNVNFIKTSLNFWNLVPQLISIPVLIILSICLIVGIIKAFTPFA